MSSTTPTPEQAVPPEPGADAPEQERLLNLVLTTSGVGLYVWDVAAGVVRYLDPRYQERGRALVWHETRADDWFALAHPDDAGAARAEVERALSGDQDGFVIRFRSLVSRSPEEEFWVQSRGEVLGRDGDGRAAQVVGSFQGVNTLVRLERQERERQAHLDMALRRASLGALTASFAHEINQPLAALTSYAELVRRLLEQGPEHLPRAKEEAERVVQLAQRAAEVVQRLRRLSTHRAPILEAVEVPALLERVRATMMGEARAEEVEIRIAVRREPWTIEVDRVHLEQILANLVRNAIQELAAAGRPGPVVVLAAERDGDRTLLRVSDNGRGVPAESVERLFEPFFSSKADGTGLGLAVSELYAEAHGGRIRLERTGEDGSTFLVELPGAGN